VYDLTIFLSITFSLLLILFPHNLIFTSLNIFFLFELLLHLYLWTPTYCWKTSWQLKVELLIQLIFFLNLYYSNPRMTDFILLIRCTRILKLLNEIPNFNLITQTMSSLLTPFYSLLLSFFILLTIYALIGD